MCFFFFKQKTAYELRISDWSSDVCSSDLVERTKDRPLATGAVRGREALALFAVLMLAAFALVLTMNRLTILMSFVGVALAASYPYLKRYTYLPQVYLGMAFGWGRSEERRVGKEVVGSGWSGVSTYP